VRELGNNRIARRLAKGVNTNDRFRHWRVRDARERKGDKGITRAPQTARSQLRHREVSAGRTSAFATK
jgi:hypothetical protein